MPAHVYADITKLLEKWIEEGVSAEAQAGALQQALDDVSARIAPAKVPGEAGSDDDEFDNMPV